MSDRQGIPLVSLATAANVNEGTVLLDAVDAIPPIKRPRGRPRRRPDKLHADKAYDSRARRAGLRRRGITPRIARKGIESSTKLGRHRWVVERTIAWLNRFRRLTIRYERNADLHLAFLDLGCALIAAALWGKRGWWCLLEVLDITEQIDGFVPSCTLVALRSWNDE